MRLSFDCLSNDLMVGTKGWLMKKSELCLWSSKIRWQQATWVLSKGLLFNPIHRFNDGTFFFDPKNPDKLKYYLKNSLLWGCIVFTKISNFIWFWNCNLSLDMNFFLGNKNMIFITFYYVLLNSQFVKTRFEKAMKK